MLCWDPLGNTSPVPRTPEHEKAPLLSARERRRLTKHSQRPQVLSPCRFLMFVLWWRSNNNRVSWELKHFSFNCFLITKSSGWFRTEQLPASPLASTMTTQVWVTGGARTGQVIWWLSVVVATQLVRLDGFSSAVCYILCNCVMFSFGKCKAVFFFTDVWIEIAASGLEALMCFQSPVVIKLSQYSNSHRNCWF